MLLFACLCPFIANAEEGKRKVSIDGITYTLFFDRALNGNQSPICAYVAGYSEISSSGVVVIPETIQATLSHNDDIDPYDDYYDYTATFPVVGIFLDAFNNCNELISVTIPKSITEFQVPESGDIEHCNCNPFCGCTNLSSISVDKDNTVFDSRDDCNAVIRKSDNCLVVGCKNTIIPASVGGIYIEAFKGCSGLLSVSFPVGVEYIEDSAFSGCSNLTNVFFSSSLKEIGEHAFYGCGSLTDVTCNYYLWCNNAFGESARNATLHVRDVDIENFKADEEDWSLFKEIVVIEKVTDFNLYYYVDDKLYVTERYKYDDEITPLDAPVRDGYTFSGWGEIPTHMPGKDVKVEGIFTSNEVKEGGVIYHVLNEQAAVIGNDNAAGEVKIAASVTFNEKEVPVTDIVDFSFKGNAEITSVVIPESVRKIGDEAFAGCKNLVTIELGKSVNQIEPRAFAGIDKLTDVICYAEDIVPDADRTAFENSYIEDYVTLHVPAGSLDKYKAAAPWKNFKEIVAIEGTETEPAKYTLIYQVDGETYQKYELEEGAEITALEEPTKEGYTFSGWDNVPETMPAEDVTIKGTFTVNKYLLIYMVDDEIYKKYDVEYGSEITAEKEPEKEGYTFSGWGTIPENMPAKDVIIKGTFTQNAAKEEEKEEVDTGEDVIKITSAGQTTWCSKYDLDFTGIEGLKAYIAPGYDRESGTIWLMRVFKVPAGEGILLMGDAKEYKVPHKPTSTYYTNMFVGTTEPKTIYESEGEFTNYYLSSGTSGVGFYRVTDAEGVQLKANRAYLPLKTSSQASTRGFVGMDFGEDGTTGMRNLTPALSKCEGVYYNLQGQRVDKPGKGLYILNGKKVVIR